MRLMIYLFSRPCRAKAVSVLLLGLSVACSAGEGQQVQGASEPSSFLQITGPCNLEFPEDHGAHAGYRTEWWYYTGNLQSEDGRDFGFQLTIFRSQIGLPNVENTWPNPRSAWRSRQLYLAHAALTDIDGKRFHHAEQMAREALGLAGCRQDSDTGTTVVFVKNWSVRLTPAVHELKAETVDFALDLAARSQKPPVLHGDLGYSLKGSTPERSSCYYSFTRLDISGTVTLEGKAVPVRGTAWMDHEFSSAPLEPGIEGWDWFSLQLSDGTELMLYLLRKGRDSYSPASSGSYVGPGGEVTHLPSDSFQVQIRNHWKSPHTGARYPSRWTIRVPKEKLDLTVVSRLSDQEMQTPGTTGVTYWEGSVSVEGTVKDRPVSGVGYVELTGYEKPFDAPM